MLADENEKRDAGDPGETMNMQGSGADADSPGGEKQSSDWVTVEMPKAKRPAKKQPAPQDAADVERTVVESPSSPPPAAGATPASQPTPGAAAGYSQNPPGGVVDRPSIEQPAPQGGMAWMEGMGIKDPGTQKIVLFGGGGLVFLCCLCSCAGLAFMMIPTG